MFYQIFKSFDLWKMITIALQGRIVVFRTLAILKKVFQALLTIFHTWLSKNYKKYKNCFFGKTLFQKQKTIYKDWKDGGRMQTYHTAYSAIG